MDSKKLTDTGQGSNRVKVVALTKDAIEQIKKLLVREKLNGHGLRINVVSGGCSGYSYKLDFVREANPSDTVVEQDSLKIYLDQSSIDHLKGTTIDYKSSLTGAGFTFQNPMATGSCGCGTSFAA
ncbi:MAG: iron-sulfur cluster assembly accessory protein [Deltaproteobacteria bacterium]|nr:iron-sulfur cluster assembly accessory protein [Deltaproteobacteria bacterium]